jgi:hypothetical protein
MVGRGKRKERQRGLMESNVKAKKRPRCRRWRKSGDQEWSFLSKDTGDEQKDERRKGDEAAVEIHISRYSHGRSRIERRVASEANMMSLEILPMCLMIVNPGLNSLSSFTVKLNIYKIITYRGRDTREDSGKEERDKLKLERT